MIGDPTPLQVAMRDGKSIAVSQCDCGRCKNEWYVVNHPDFTPRYCPYCGMKFTRCEEKDLKPAE